MVVPDWLLSTGVILLVLFQSNAFVLRLTGWGLAGCRVRRQGLELMLMWSNAPSGLKGWKLGGCTHTGWKLPGC